LSRGGDPGEAPAARHDRAPGLLPAAAGIALLGAAAVLIAGALGADRWIITALGAVASASTAALVLAATTLAHGMRADVLGEPHAPAPAEHDPLTGLPGAAKLRADLERRIQSRAEPTRLPTTLILFALEGLKKYNDSYGHACGDALIAWLGRKLSDAVSTRAEVYRPRGGEFVLLMDAEADVADEVLAAADAALSEIGDGFVIWSSHGQALVPDEAATVSDALKLVDRRAQAHRSSPHVATGAAERAGVPEDPLDVLRFTRPRYDVAELAAAVGRRMGLAGAALEQLEVAAQLRDVGNMAIPATVLGHAGRLSQAEWRFVRLHTLVGERLLAANFGMEEVAAAVRSSHERWDGFGYPDALAGEEIPLASRIVFVCSAFQDMTSTRAHRAELGAAAALAELEAGAGTQFDPEVVAAFREEWSAVQERAPEIARPLAWRRMRVLVAEDDAASRFLLRRAIEAGGHDCLTADDGEQAWELFRAEHPEVVVSDWLMPRMDGDELCRRIREDPDAPYTYFIMITALEDKAHVLRGMQAGADDFLTKPLDHQDLEVRLIAASRVTALHRRVRQQQQAIQSEVDLAASVQRGLLPAAPPEFAGVDVDGQCIPAANVGGDYFDYLVDGQGRLILVIADVAGHSISSALLMAMARSILRREVTAAVGPAQLLEATNRALFADLVRAELFITAFCACYDPRLGRLEYANGGHNPPYLRRADGSLIVLDTDGVAIGILEEGGYEQRALQLRPGDILLLYTDGVVESADPEQRQFGDERLRDLVGRSNGASPHELIDAVLGAVRDHATGQQQQDDVTLVALRVTGTMGGGD
jgi:diguanylate cyclase (GGDEF)-like protein